MPPSSHAACPLARPAASCKASLDLPIPPLPANRATRPHGSQSLISHCRGVKGVLQSLVSVHFALSARSISSRAWVGSSVFSASPTTAARSLSPALARHSRSPSPVYLLQHVGNHLVALGNLVALGLAVGRGSPLLEAVVDYIEQIAFSWEYLFRLG